MDDDGREGMKAVGVVWVGLVMGCGEDTSSGKRLGWGREGRRDICVVEEVEK